MHIALFCHSLRSDWNHGNAHFLRGVVWRLQDEGHAVRVFEPRGGWSAAGLARDHGAAALSAYQAFYPGLSSELYDEGRAFDLEAALGGVQLVLVHEWTSPAMIARLGRWRAAHPEARVLFHDTHHRSVTRPHEMAACDLRHYDGVLAFGARVRAEYLRRGWAARAWTWHEAADARVFRPLDRAKTVDVAWIGNWGDGERTAELHEFLIHPIARLSASAVAYGVRYPAEARAELAAAGIHYAGWLPNYRVPEAFAAARATVHIPRAPYVAALPGVPTIRPFEALACGVPLVSAPWDDAEGLFRPGRDFLVARTGAEMAAALRLVLHEPAAAAELAANGRATVLARHTCAHRVRELIGIAAGLGLPCRPEAAPADEVPA
jgi:spore maturation protein CgeB